MERHNPVIAAFALDSSTPDMVRAAEALARRMRAPILPVHALPRRFAGRVSKLEARGAQARTEILAHLAPAVDQGVTVLEPVIAPADPALLILHTASMAGAQLVVVGGGEPETVKRWLMGNVAERVVRSARQPVFIARGTMPGADRPIVCPVDLSPQSHLAFVAALRMARLFEAPLRVVTVIPPEDRVRYTGADLNASADRIESTARAEIDVLLAAHDHDGIDVQVDVLAGRPTAQILEAASDAHLVVIGSGGFDHLLPGTFGGVTEKVLRGAWASVMAVRDSDPDAASREAHVRRVAELKVDAERRLAAGDAVGAESSLLAALHEAPANAALHDMLASVLEALDRKNEAVGHIRVAALIRESLG